MVRKHFNYAVLFICILFVFSVTCCSTQTYDLVILGGTVFYGTGVQGYEKNDTGAGVAGFGTGSSAITPTAKAGVFGVGGRRRGGVISDQGDPAQFIPVDLDFLTIGISNLDQVAPLIVVIGDSNRLGVQNRLGSC